MNLTRHLGARGARRQFLRVTVLALACLVALAIGNFPFGASATRAATPQGTKLPTVKRKAALVAQQQTGKSAKSAKPNSVLPTSTNCPIKTPISPGQTINSTLASGDCTLTSGEFFDEFTFNATTGQQISVQMSSTAIDTYLILLAPDNTDLFEDDDGGGNTNSRIPSGSGFFTVPQNGVYSILATSFSAGETGAYAITLTFGSGSGTVCPPNPTPITNGQTLNGTLDANDCRLPDNTAFDAYSFTATAGQQVTITLNGTTPLDAYLLLIAPDGTDIAEDDNGGGGLNARIPAGAGFATLPQTGSYTILANAASAGSFGNYSLSLSIAATNCPSTPITIGQTVNGTLATSDCRLPADGSFLDLYTFTGTAGQQIAITETTSSFNAFLFLLDNTGADIADDGPTTNPPPPPPTNARIPGPTGFFTLPVTGTYTIVANAALAGQTGAYTLSLVSSASCTYTLAQPSANVPAAAGSFSVGVTTQAGCGLTSAQVSTTAPFITIDTVTMNANGTGTVNYTVAANTTSTPRTGTINIAGQTFTVTQAANCTYTIYPTIRPFRETGGTNGRLTVVTNNAPCGWSAASDSPWITITLGTTGTGTGRVRYTVAPNPDATTRVGHITVTGTGATPVVHTVTQTAAATTPSVQLSAAAYIIAENDASNSAVITVTRTGDTTGAVTVEYSTVDDPAAVPCDPTATAQRGTAYARCDYATTIDTLTFQPGETTKTFKVPLINDVHVEGDETFQVRLANPEGATLGAQQAAVVTITDNDTAQPSTNPINQSSFFVRQQYLDFLSREPDPPGFSAWLNVLNGCPDVNNLDPNAPSAQCDRILVSASFFGSQEFQLKGTFVFLFEKVAFGNPSTPNFVPSYLDFAADLRRVTGSSAAEVFAKRLDFTEDFVTRPAFIARYGSMTNAQYVDALLANVGATLTTPDPTSGATRNSLVSALDAGTITRADALRTIVESNEVNQKQFNFAFVAAEYYGYLRRTPDAPGYNAWITFLNANPSQFRTMVNGFMNSTEYRLRFGPNVGQ